MLNTVFVWPIDWISLVMTCYRRQGEATTTATNSESGRIFVENRKTKLFIQRALKNNEIYDVSAFSEGFQAMGSSFKRLVLRRPRYKVVISWPSIPFSFMLFQARRDLIIMMMNSVCIVSISSKRIFHSGLLAFLTSWTANNV